MSKYNKGDKFVIEIDEVFRNDADDIIHEEELYRIRGFKSLVFDDYGLDKLQQAITPAEDGLIDMAKVTEANNKGLEDAWELVKNYAKMSMAERKRIFGVDVIWEILNLFTPQEALAKLEAYEKEQAEIKVGDVVKIDATHSCGIVIAIDEMQRKARLMFEDGKFAVCDWYFSDLIKTGKHIDIQSILEQMKAGAE